MPFISLIATVKGDSKKAVTVEHGWNPLCLQPNTALVTCILLFSEGKLSEAVARFWVPNDVAIDGDI